MNKGVLKQPKHWEQAIREYVELEAEGETVTHLEKLTTEYLSIGRFDAWDVWTDNGRYWVITNGTNLYSQRDFPSLDYTLSFHIGLGMRVAAKQSRKASDVKSRDSEPAWRRWEQAATALDSADEAEEFQAVGMRCRECLVSFVKSVSSNSMVPAGQEAPKAGDFIHWAELIANIAAKGQSAEEVRGYLKAMSRSTWQLVGWLTHAENAVLFDAIMAVDATEKLLTTFDMALIRHAKGTPDRCPKCSSYRVISNYRTDSNPDSPFITLCETCGWTDLPVKP